MFAWLYDQCPNKHFQVNGRNMLQLAALSGSFFVVSYCVNLVVFPPEDYFRGHPDMFAELLANQDYHAVDVFVRELGSRLYYDPHNGVNLLHQYYNRPPFLSSTFCCAVWTGSVDIQRYARRYIVQRRYKHYLREHYASYVQFRRVWGAVCDSLQNTIVKTGVSWAAIKQIYNFTVNADESSGAEVTHLCEQFAATAGDVVQDASSSRPVVDDKQSEPVVLLGDSVIGHSVEELVGTVAAESHTTICSVDISSAVLKWFNRADRRYRQLFQRRMKQLAAGDRSYALSKRLQHCRYPMWETKLDAGQRILWTTVSRTTGSSILVWFVSKHDDVSHFVKLINETSNRMARQLSVGTDRDHLVLSEEDVLIDPTGNCPLKIYQTTVQQLGDESLTAVGAVWTPPLRLSAKQREANEESGTVLLLGRSGTGKTICLCDRMTRDRSGHVGPLKQLFVCRSKRLCEFVQTNVQQGTELEGAHFMTLSAFTGFVENALSVVGSFESPRRVDYHRFLAVIWPKIKRKCPVAPAVVWLHIRSFIKGSVEAVIARQPVALQTYTDLAVFGPNRCRLSVDDRKEVYAVFMRYQNELKAQGLWDDADYTLHLLNRSKLEPLGTSYDKVYVDEVQDNTQAEIVLYFLAAGMNTRALFLAGDPAQSVVEGVDFRFEEVRSIVYELSGRILSIARPLTLTVNYRSHAGILNCAAAVLDKMFTMFPAAAKCLPGDAGLFKGPRPACCQVDGMEGLMQLLRHNERLIVLCDDSEVESVESQLAALGVRNLVLGIRAAKGLEFQDVVLLDFFARIPKQDQSVWKSLFTSDQAPDSNGAPHIELQLKLLYTAITRSCNRLLFVETCDTPLSSVMFRWLTGPSGLAETFSVDSEQPVLMTSDEWRVQGIEFALSAEGDSTEMFLEKAVKCFVNASDGELEARARAELELRALQRKVNFTADSGLSAADEAEAARVVLAGLQQGLVPILLELCGFRSLARMCCCQQIFMFEVAEPLLKICWWYYGPCNNDFKYCSDVSGKENNLYTTQFYCYTMTEYTFQRDGVMSFQRRV